MKKLVLLFILLMGVTPCFAMEDYDNLTYDREGHGWRPGRHISESGRFEFLETERRGYLRSERIPERFYVRTLARNSSDVMDYINKKSFRGASETVFLFGLSAGGGALLGLSLRWGYNKFWWGYNKFQLYMFKNYLKTKFPRQDARIDEITNLDGFKQFIKDQFQNSNELHGLIDNGANFEELRAIINNEIRLQEFKDYLKTKFPRQDAHIDGITNLDGFKQFIKDQFTNLTALFNESINDAADFEALKPIIELQQFKDHLKIKFPRQDAHIDGITNLDGFKQFIKDQFTNLTALFNESINDAADFEALKPIIELQQFKDYLKIKFPEQGTNIDRINDLDESKRFIHTNGEALGFMIQNMEDIVTIAALREAVEREIAQRQTGSNGGNAVDLIEEREISQRQTGSNGGNGVGSIIEEDGEAAEEVIHIESPTTPPRGTDEFLPDTRTPEEQKNALNAHVKAEIEKAKKKRIGIDTTSLGGSDGSIEDIDEDPDNLL